MRQHERHEGTWAGTNAFRLMPDDPASEAPMTARVARAAGGGLTQIAYTWAHPEDGRQDGLLVLGAGEDPSTAVAFWGDSWHQRPQPRILHGVVGGGVASVGYDYAGDWRWEVVVDTTDPEALRLTMNNVVPVSAAEGDEEAGPYAAMSAVLRRTD